MTDMEILRAQLKNTEELVVQLAREQAADRKYQKALATAMRKVLEQSLAHSWPTAEIADSLILTRAHCEAARFAAGQAGTGTLTRHCDGTKVVF